MELWDLYDKDRVRTGRTMVRGEPVPEGLFRMTVHIAIFNPKGEMLIQRRCPEKQGWGGMWDISVGGSAIAGESSSQAAERELLEELGIRYDLSLSRPSFSIAFGGGVGDMYIINGDFSLDSLVLQQSEVCDARYASRDEILRMIDGGSFIPYHSSVIELLYHLREGNGAHLRQSS